MDGTAKRLDKFEKLASEASFMLILLANESTGDWVLLSPEPVPADMDRTYKERGLCFAGVLGVVAGKPRTALDMPLDDATITAITQEFCRRVERLVTHPCWTMRPVLTAN